MAKLTSEQQVFIVTRLACFDSNSTVVDAVKSEFGVTVTKQQVHLYDPTKANGNGKLSQKLKTLFYETRERFKVDVEDIPIANKSYRLRVLQRMVDKTERMKNFALTAQILDQAAKEVGDDKRLTAEKTRLEIEKLKRDLAGDKEDERPTPVAVNINVVDARKRDDSADA